MKVATVLFVLLLGTTAAIAADVPSYLNTLSVKQYAALRNNHGSDLAIKIYLLGAGNAFMLMNLKLEDDNMSRLYCQPGTETVIKADTYRDIVDHTMKQLSLPAGDATDDDSILDVLLIGLRHTYPCQH
jgi:hypothetical protein